MCYTGLPCCNSVVSLMTKDNLNLFLSTFFPISAFILLVSSLFVLFASLKWMVLEYSYLPREGC